MPGTPSTRDRWSALADLAGTDLVAARFAEADQDARTVLGELDGPEPHPDDLWGLWAAEPPDGPVLARLDDAGTWRLRGRKRWCSGLGRCTHALVTARYDTPDGTQRRLFALDVRDPAARPELGEWVGPGMAGSATGSVDLDDAPATAVGGDRAYLDRPGFWHGAARVAACWYGGAVGVAHPLRAAVRDRADPHAAAHLGAVDAALGAAAAVLRAAADEIDAGDPSTEAGVRTAQRRSLVVRAVVEQAVDTTLTRVGRALGPAPLALDADHARRVADLTVYVRQSHAERDLAALGLLSTDETGAL